MSWQVLQLDGSTWYPDTNFPEIEPGVYGFPNPGRSEVATAATAQHEIVTLHDGSKAVLKPPAVNRISRESLSFEITEAHSDIIGTPTCVSTLVYGMEEAIKDGKKRKIITHTGEEVEGFFRTWTKPYLLSGSKQLHRLSVTFDVV